MLVAGKGVLEFAEHQSMEFPRRKFLHLAAGAAAFPSLPRVASALDYPTRPLTLVVPFAAGGPSDVAGRVIAQRMSEVFGKPVVVENLSGAGGTIGSAARVSVHTAQPTRTSAPPVIAAVCQEAQANEPPTNETQISSRLTLPVISVAPP